MQLAVLDHNQHAGRNVKTNKKGEVIYARKYRKASRKWDVTPTLEQKKYNYIPRLIKEIKSQRQNSDHVLKQKLPTPGSHPNNIQHTIGEILPSGSRELASNKRSRFSNT